ncbi:hypothetical protein BsWGS_28070 [Bradybaena similaris]
MDLRVDDQHSLTPSKGVIDPETINALYSEQIEVQEAAVQRLRKRLSAESNPPRDAVIQAGIIPRLVQYLYMDNRRSLQLEAAGALTHIVAGTTQQTQVVINAGAVPVFIRLLSAPTEDIQNQAVWALGNIAGDSPKNRDLVLDAGILPSLLRLLCQCAGLAVTRNAVWCLYNLCSGKQAPDFSKVSQALPILSRLLNHSDEKVLANACWTLSHLSYNSSENRQAVINSGVCPKLVELLTHINDSVSAAALRTIGNIVTGDDDQTQVVIDCSALPSLLQLLGSSKETIRKEACWVISNITIGTPHQIQDVIDCNIIPALVNILEMPESENKTKMEAAWAIANATFGGRPQQIRFLVNQNCIPTLCDLLTMEDKRLVHAALNSLENILSIGEFDANLGSNNIYVFIIKECGGKIPALQAKALFLDTFAS